MTWQRQPVAEALVAAITAVVAGTATVFERPPTTLNAPAIVVGRPTEVRYSVVAFGVDEVTLPIVCLHGAIDQDDAVSALIDQVRKAVEPTPTLGGVVAIAYASGERNWRNVKVSGTDLLAAELTLTIHM